MITNTPEAVEKLLQAAIKKNPAHVTQFMFGLETDEDDIYIPREEDCCPIGLFLLGKSEINPETKERFSTVLRAAEYYLGISLHDVSEITAGFDAGSTKIPKPEGYTFWHVGQRLYNFWQNELNYISREDFLRPLGE